MLQVTTLGRKAPSRQVIRGLGGPASVELLEKLFLEETSRVTIIAIDFEYDNDKKDNPIKVFNEIGISTFSTIEWHHPPGIQKSKIHSRCYIMPKMSPGRFLFGESQRMLRRDIPQFLQNTISMKSPAGAPSKVVLVGHHVHAELDILQEIGIDLRDHKLYSIEGILNIATLTREVGLPFTKLPSLGTVLKYLGIPFQKCRLHNAGNDAHFTLRALLMLAAKSFERMELGERPAAQISNLKSIALDPIDFESRTPDSQKYQMELDVKRALKREHAIGSSDDDLWCGSEEESLGMTLFGMDVDI
jgi:hypothetical protein